MVAVYYQVALEETFVSAATASSISISSPLFKRCWIRRLQMTAVMVVKEGRVLVSSAVSEFPEIILNHSL